MFGWVPKNGAAFLGTRPNISESLYKRDKYSSTLFYCPQAFDTKYELVLPDRARDRRETLTWLLRTEFPTRKQRGEAGGEARERES